jgi:hypothetical protein
LAADIAVGEGQIAARGVLGAVAEDEGQVLGQRHHLDQVVAHEGVDGRIGVAHHVVGHRHQGGQLLEAGDDLARAGLRGGDRRPPSAP